MNPAPPPGSPSTMPERVPMYLDVADPIRIGGKVRPVLTCRFDY